MRRAAASKVWRMKIAIVGAGAVGQVYARHLELGGAEVFFVVKPSHIEEARQGFELYPLNRRRARSHPAGLRIPAVTSVAEAMARRPDAVLLGVSSTALRSGEWLDDLAGAIGDATLVTLQPAPADYAYIAERVHPDQIAVGLIGFLSYPGPLPGEELPRPGTVYWFPPLARSALTGDDARVRPIVDALRRGGLPVRVAPDTLTLSAFGAAVLQPVVIALEIAGWSTRELRRRRELFATAHAATREAIEIVGRYHGASPPLSIRMARPLSLRLALGVGARAAPLDLDAYLRLHFTKVGDQTRLWIEDIRALAEEQGASHDALAELERRLAQA